MPAGWVSAGWRRARPLFANDGSPLAERFALAAARLGTLNGATSIEEFLARSPYVAMLEALRQDYGLDVNDARLEAFGEGAVALYFHVRLVDDLIDEPEQYARECIYVAEMFSAASQRAFSEAVADPVAFLRFREQTMAGHFSASAWDVDVVRTTALAEDDIARIGAKVLYRAVALGAMAMLAGRTDHLGHWTQFMMHYGTTLQMANDVMNVREDHVAGRTTPVLHWLYGGGRASPDSSADTLRVALLADPALPRALACARRHAAEAEGLARSNGASRVADLVREEAAR